MRFLIFALVFLMTSIVGWSSQLISHRKINYFSKDDIKSRWKEINIPQLYMPVNNGIILYEITYTTEWIDGTCIEASGVVLVPDNLYKGYSTIIYHNGTSIMKKREENLGYNQFSLCAGFAADGYLVIIPDYIGRGVSKMEQPYLHVKSEGQNSVDFIKAASIFMESMDMDPIDGLFITGYSQGGHSALSTQYMIEKKYPNDFNVLAASPMSGPYDLSGILKVEPGKEYTDVLLFMYFIYAYQEVYELRSSLSEIFNPPYDSLSRIYFDGYHTYRDYRKILPSKAEEVMQREFILTELVADKSRLKDLLVENSPYKFVPSIPTQFCYCEDDELVSGSNSITAYEWMKSNGAEKVKLVNVGKELNHDDCAVFAFVYTKFYFDKYRDVKRSNFKNDFSNAALRIALTSQKLFPKIKFF